MTTSLHSADLMRERLNAYEPERALPRDFYVDPVYFSQELRSLWYQDWLFIGHECELVLEGDRLTATVGEYTISILRDDGGDG